MAIEDEFEIEILDSDADALQTAGDLVVLVRAKLLQSAASPRMHFKDSAGAEKKLDKRSIVGRRPKPGVIETCELSPVDKPPQGARWAHEVKWDRGQAHLKDGKIQFFTCVGNDWSERFLTASQAVERLRTSNAILDREVVAFKGALSDFHELRPSFKGLRDDLMRKRGARMHWLEKTRPAGEWAGLACRTAASLH